MADPRNLMVQMVEYLAAWPGEAKVGSPPVEEPVVVLTFRPDERSFRPHNVGISWAQAERLWEDLGSILQKSAVFLLLALCTGCSARVDVERENWRKTSSEANGRKDRTAVQVEVMQNLQPEGKTIPQPSEPKPAMVRQINVSGDNNIIIVPGDGPAVQARAADKAEEKAKRGLNTKIGWPSDYWKGGLWACLSYAAMCVLLGWAMVIMTTLVTCDVKLDEPLLPIIWTTGLLVAATVVLQTLPAVESGIQFIPLAPWGCSGFVPVSLSIFCWLGILVAVFSTLTRCLDSPTVFSAAVLFSMGCNLVLSFVG